MRLLHTALMATAVIVLAAVMCVSAQDSQPKFEVASIKRQLPPIGRLQFALEPGRLIIEGFPVRYLLMTAYGVHSGDIFGAPDWVDSDRYRIEAEADGIIPKDELPRMLQSLLVDRFQLKTHQEKRELPVYELMVAKGGSKLTVSEDQTPAVPPPVTGDPIPANSIIPRGAFGFGAGSVGARAVPLSRLTDLLRFRLGRPVLDKTGLTGLFDIKLRWDPRSEQASTTFEASPNNALVPQGDNGGPSIFTALQEQLGLKLESARRPVEVLVIDRASKPAEN